MPRCHARVAAVLGCAAFALGSFATAPASAHAPSAPARAALPAGDGWASADGRRPDSAQPSYYGRLYQQHDGELDVVRGADLVTLHDALLR